MIEEPNQSVGSLVEQYLRFAYSEKDEYLATLRKVAKETGCTYPEDAEKTCIKTSESLEKKLKQRQLSQITDVLRFTLIINHPNDKETILTCLKEYGYRVWTNPKTGKEDITDRFLDPKPGYKDIAIKLVKSEADLIVKELQLIQSHMYEAKQEKGHDIYDSIKNLESQRREVLKRNDPLELEQELAEIDEDIKEYEELSDALYQDAFERDNPAGIGKPSFS